MEWQAVSDQLYDLPKTYLRSGNTFQWWQNSLTSGLSTFTYSMEGLSEQFDFATSSGNWLSVWGQLFYINRNLDEDDKDYQARITMLLRYGRGTAPAIQQYVNYGLEYSGFVTENLPACSWSLTLSEPLTTAQILTLAQNLTFVRPAGVPCFPIYTTTGGLFLGTINYLGAQAVTGAYLNNPTTGTVPNIGASTNEAQPTLPTTYLTDPFLNGAL